MAGCSGNCANCPNRRAAVDVQERPRTWTTYRMANGEPIWGDYAWVDSPEFFDDLDEPIEVVKEVWVLQNSDVVTFGTQWDYEEELD